MLLIIASLLLAVASFAAFAPRASANPQDIEKSIVRLQIDWAANVNFLGTDDQRHEVAVTVAFSCTGFFVSTKGHIATAGHCMEGSDAEVEIVKEFLRIYQVPAENQQAVVEQLKIGAFERTVQAYQPPGVAGTVLESASRIKVQVVDFQPFTEGDNALLKINNFDTETPALIVAAAAPEIGTEVTAVGFPGSLRAVSDDARFRPTFKQGKVSSRQTSNSGVPFTEIDASMSQGMSGGPTVDTNTNAVYGVNSFGIRGETGDFNSISDTDALRAFLVKNGVELASNGDSPTDSGSGLVIGLIVGGGFVLAVLISGIVLLVKRASRPTVPQQPQQLYPPQFQTHGQWQNQQPQQPPPNWQPPQPPQGPGPH